MSTRLPLAESSRSWRGWLIPAALLALAPKCVMCLIAYAGIGAALGLGGPELCGATDSAAGSWPTWLLFGLAAIAIGIYAHRLGRRA